MPNADILTKEQLELLNQTDPKEMAKILAASNAGYWAEQNKLKLQSGTFSFHEHEYLEEPLNGPTDRKYRAYQRCYMKAPQGGFSIAEAIDNIHGMIHGRYPQGVMHLLPTKPAVEEFGKSKYGPIINRNKKAVFNFIKRTGLKGADSASIKKINDAFLYLRSATLNPDDEGDGKSSVSLSSISIDKVDFDEIELMDNESIAKAKGRAAHSKNPEFCYIFNPGGEDSGGDLIWQQSDQRHWFRRCDCTAGDLSSWTCAELDFPDCVKEYPDSLERRKERKDRGYIACKNCGKPLPFYQGPGTGMWIPSKPDIVDFDGYRWSHLTSHYHDPLDILEEFIDPPYGNIGDVYRLRLGLPYSSAEDKLKKEVVLRCCGNRQQQMHHRGPCFFGMDVGKIMHLVIGYKVGKEDYEVVRIAKPESFEDAFNIILDYGVKVGVVDIRPYEDSAKKFAAKCREEGMTVFLCQYDDNPAVVSQFNDNNFLVKTFRTGVCDRTHRIFSSGNIVLPDRSSAMENFAEQCCNVEKYADTNRYGQKVYRYRACGSRTVGDHFRHAMNYFVTAGDRARVVTKANKTLQRKVIST